MTEDQLLAMKLHVRVNLNDNDEIMRVPGGWIYTQYEGISTTSSASVFVPEPLAAMKLITKACALAVKQKADQ